MLIERVRCVCAIVPGLLVFALLALGACATTPEPAAPVTYVMRHLNTPAGERDPDLLPEGQRAAQALAGWFGRERLRAIYVSDFRRLRPRRYARARRARPHGPASGADRRPQQHRAGHRRGAGRTAAGGPGARRFRRHLARRRGRRDDEAENHAPLKARAIQMVTPVPPFRCAFNWTHAQHSATIHASGRKFVES